MAKYTLNTVLTTDNYHDFMSILRDVPTATKETNQKMFSRYKLGDPDAFEELILCNLRLIVNVAKPYRKDLKSMEFLDVVHEGIMGFIRSLDTFDPQKGTSLSTYAVPWIDQFIKRAIYNEDDMIRRPDHFNDYMRQYKKLRASREAMGLPLPTIDDILNELHVSKETARNILDDYKKDSKSLQDSIGDEEDSTLEMFVGTSDGGYDQVLNSMTESDLFANIKAYLSPKEYFIYYYRVITDEKISLQTIADTLNMTRQRIDQIGQNASKKLARIINRDGTLRKRMIKRSSTAVYNIEPMDLNLLLKFLFVMNYLSDKERELYILWLTRIEEKDAVYYAETLNLTPAELAVLAQNIRDIIEIELADKKRFDTFKRLAIGHFRANILNLDLRKINLDLVEKIEHRQPTLFLIKKNLSEFQFYCFYKNSIEKQSHLSISHLLDVTVEEVKKSLIQSSNIIESLKTKYKNDLQTEKLDMRLTPLEPETIYMYLFLAPIMDELKRAVYYEWFIVLGGQCDVERIAKRTSMSSNEVKTISGEILSLIEFAKNESRTYSQFKSDAKNFFGAANILDLNLPKMKIPMSLYSSSIECFVKSHLCEISNLNLPVDTARFFLLRKEKSITLTEVEREMNAIKFGYKGPTTIALAKLWSTLEENKNRFTELEYDTLLTFVFNRMSRKDYRTKYPDVGSTEKSVLRKLENIHYGIVNYKGLGLNRDIYIKVRPSALKQLSKDDIDLLDSFYGVGMPCLSSMEYATKHGLEYESVRTKTRLAKERIVKLYISDEPENPVPNEVYISYLNCEEVALTDRNREIALKYYRDSLDTDVLGKKYHLTRPQVATILLDVKRQIDFYRFGILSIDDKYSKEEKENVANALFDGKDLLIVRDIIAGIPYKKIAQAHDVSVEYVKKTSKKMYARCYNDQVSSVTVTVSDIKKELALPRVESILTDRERQLLTLYYGCHSTYNPGGLSHSSIETERIMNIDSEKFFHLHKAAVESIAAKKLGLIKPTLAYMTRQEMIEALNDCRIPISDKERAILGDFYGITSPECLRLTDLKSKYEMTENSIRRRIMRATLTIKKYYAGEIKKGTSYDLDIKPYLKFFSKSDREVLELSFKEKIPQVRIAKQLNMTRDQLISLLDRIVPLVKYYKEGIYRGYDFEKFWAYVDDERVPYYEDKEHAKKLVHMFFEERMDAEKIASLFAHETRFTILNQIYGLMCAVAKRLDGVVKTTQFTYEEIRDYYLLHESEMPIAQKMYYYRYFNRMKNPDRALHISEPFTSWAINLDLIKDRFDGYLSLSNLTREEIIKFIRENKSALSHRAFVTLLEYYEICEWELLSPKDKTKLGLQVYRAYVLKKEKRLGYHPQ